MASPAADLSNRASMPALASSPLVAGAEGGAQAIGVRRRESRSFKTMSTGSLVSNSPFTKRLGGVTSPTSPQAPSTGLYSASRIPTANSNSSRSPAVQRRTSGSRKVSGEEEGPVKENFIPRKLSSEFNQQQDEAKPLPTPRSRSTSPSVPFRPVRHHTSSSSSSGIPTASNSTASALGSAGAPFKPSRPTFLTRQSREELVEGEPRRSSSSYAAVRKNGLVSSSPFVTKSTSPSSIPAPLPVSATATLDSSPDLVQAPYEIAPLSHESAPFSWSYNDQQDDLPQQQPLRHKDSTSAIALGARPGGGPGPSSAGERRIAGSSVPPPNTPPHQRTASYSGSPSPSSALSPQRRGMKGPRAPTPVEQYGGRMMGDETETEAEDLGRTLRRQPSGKTVTWAATEEVLEFEVDDRRASGVSTASTLSEDSGRYYGGGGGGDESYEEEHSGFEEGGSVEVHDVDVESTDDEESVVSGASTVEDMIGEIDDFMEESFDDIDVFSPSQIDPEGFQQSPQPQRHQQFVVEEEEPEPTTPTTPTDATTSSTAGYREYQTLPGPSSAFSTSSNSQVSTGTSDDADDATSLSSYDDDEAEALKYAREQILIRSQASSSPNLASIPTMRSPLPSPPTTSTATLGAPFSLAPPVAQATADSSNRDSTFSLPDIPGTSPFMGFEDDGAAGSVVTLDMERQRVPATQPLSPRAPPAQSTPSSSRITDPRASFVSTGADSPILSAFGRASPPPLHSPRAQPQQQQQLVNPSSPDAAQLSRQASIVNSDVSSYVPSDVGSWFGSMSSGGGAGSLLIGRDRLQRKMKEHEAILGSGVSSPALEPGRFPTEASSSTATTAGAQEHDAVEILQARPAPKARSATLSSNMLPTITGQAGARELEVGAPLTSELAHGMQSPLERLHRGLEGRKEGEEWRRGDSLLGVGAKGEESDEEQGQMQRSESAMAVREKAILERKRSKNGGKGGRRRSSSTSDAPLAETTSAPMSTLSAMPEFGFENRLNDALPGTSAGFGDNVQSSLDDIFNSRNRTYRVHERKAVVYAADVSAGVKSAGDVDPGRAWRKKRPSNMHEVNRSLSVMSISSTSSSKKSRALTGQLFVQLREASIEGMPFPRERTSVTFSLDNGRQRVEAGIRVLDSKVVIRNEFDLVCSEGLAFTIDLHVPPKPAPPPPMLTPAPPASPTKKSGFRSVFSSPKKKVATPPVRAAAPQPLPDPFYDFVDRDGKIASAHFVFAEEASKCKLRKHRFNVPFTNVAARKACKGAMSIDMLYVPATPSIPRDSLPKSMDEALAGMEAAERASKIIHEGVLTQLGGDCSIWRRRNCKLRGNRLVPYNEVTKMSHVEIDLSLVTSVDDLNAPSPASTPGSRATTYDADAELGAMDHSFRLVFKDASSIDFFADAAETKEQWLEILRKEVAIATVNTKAPPSWALTMRKLVAAGRV